MKQLYRLISRLIEEPFRSRQKKRIRYQKYYNKQNFIEHFDNLNIDQTITEIVWNRFGQEVSIEGFVPMPNDEIVRLYGIVDEDMEDLLHELLTECNKVIPTQDTLLTMKPLETIQDMVLFLSRCVD
jgi:hypothetical protein